MRRIICLSLLMILQLADPATSEAGKGTGFWTGHGNHRMGKNALTVGQTRTLIARAIARKINASHTGQLIKPSQVNVSINIGPDGKALWSAEIQGKQNSLQKKLSAKFKVPKVVYRGAVEVEKRSAPKILHVLRHMLKMANRREAEMIVHANGWGNRPTYGDVRLAAETLSQFGQTPHRKTVIERAEKLYHEHKAFGEQSLWKQLKSNWATAKKELITDLDHRVSFLSAKQFSAAAKQLRP